MSVENARRKLAAILSADVKGYSRLMEQDELSTIAVIKEYRIIFAELTAECRGRVVDSAGDNILAEFASVVDAVDCALRIQKELRERNARLSENRRLEFRIGINLGDVIEDGERIYGDGVNIAARVQSLAEAGGICLSGTSYDQVEGKLPLTYRDLGEHRFKNISKPIQVYAIHDSSPRMSRQPVTRLKRYRLKIIMAAIFAVLFASGLWMRSNWRTPNLLRSDLSIAVLPFVDMSPEKDQEYFADGLAEELLNALSQVPALRVVGRTSSFQFRGKNEDLRIIGRKLNVSKILEGSVRKEGGRVRITAQLINASNGFHLWSETYDYEVEDIFAVQEQIAASVTAALKLALIGENALSGQTKNSEAFDLYLLGQYYSGRRSLEDLEKAVDYYNQAIKLDPNYALACVSLAVARLRQADWGHIPVEEGYREGREAVQRALMINPNLATAHSVLGRIKMNYDWDWSGAGIALQRSLKLEPNNARVLGNAAAFFMVMDRQEEGISMMRRVAQLDPLNQSAHFNLGTYAYYTGRLDEAANVLRKALEINPKGLGIHLILGLVLLAEKRPQDALMEIKQETDPGFRLYGLALVYHSLGRNEDSNVALANLIAGYQSDSAFQIAEIYAYRMNFDKAFEWLERAYAQHDSGLPMLKLDPLMKNIKSDSRYLPFMRKMGLEP